MQVRTTVVVTAIIIACFAGCNQHDSSKSTAEKKAKEQSQKNPLEKGRYLCYFLLPGGDKVAPHLYILSNDMYQVNDTTGHYKYHPKNAEIEWRDGPFYKPSENWVGVYISKGTTTAGGGKTLESMIQIQSQKKGSNKRFKLMQCNCAQFE